MKKTIAMLLATATTLSVGMTALASDVNTAREAIGETVLTEGETPTEDSANSEGTASEGTGSESSTPSDGSDSSTPAADPTAFSFGADADNDGAILGQTILEPGSEYKFPVSLTVDGEVKEMTDELIKDYKFAYTKVSSNGVQKFEIKDYKGKYYLYVTIRDGVSTKVTDVKYNVKLVRKSNNLTVLTQEVKFQYGHDESNNDYISNLGKGDVVEIDNARPVITNTQFEKIAKINDYKNVTLSGPSWSFTVNVTDEATKNMVSNNAGIKDVTSSFPDQDFKFFNFGGKPSFNSTGRVALDVDDIVDEYDNMYLYRYADGKLYRINATHNKDDNTLEFRTNKLDSFLVTNKAIKDGYVVNDDVKGDSVSKPDADNNGGSNGGKENPSTGASDMINVAVMAAIASLGAAGAMAAKKFSK